MRPEQFASRHSSDESRREVIRVLAFAQNDNGWPLGILQAIAPDLAHALTQWTGKYCGDIRREQESGSVVPGSAADILQRNFADLPLWEDQATHVSKSSAHFDQHQLGDELRLRSFMGCCAPGFTFAYVAQPRSTLKFAELKSARLIGALTTENFEREVVLPPGAKFQVIARDIVSRTITLREI